MATTTTTSSPPFLRPFLSLKSLPPKSSLHLPKLHNRRPLHHAFNSTHCFSPAVTKAKRGVLEKHLCFSARRKPILSSEEGEDNLRRVLRISLWVAEGVYILWLFLLPYAPVCTLFYLLKFSICHMRRMFINLNWFWSWLIPMCVLRYPLQLIFTSKMDPKIERVDGSNLLLQLSTWNRNQLFHNLNSFSTTSGSVLIYKKKKS